MSTEPSKPRWTRVVRSWAIELLIVFVGVYAAFKLSEIQAAREAGAHREQIELALSREIEEITVRTRRAAEQTPRLIAYYDSTIASGLRPDLRPMIEPLNVQTHMWEATLQSGGLNLLDVPTLYRVSEFYNALNAGFAQLDQLRALSETVLIPNLNAGPAEFYDARTGALRPKYQWYLDGMRNVSDLAYGITQLGDEVVSELRGATD